MPRNTCAPSWPSILAVARRTCLNSVVGSYGAPEEVAEIYRDQEIKIQRAIRPPPVPQRRSPAGRFFGAAADPHTYGALFYMLLVPSTAIFYFVWAVTGVALSAGLSILVIGLPFMVLFLGSVRVFSLLEGRIVETMLGVRMPRRPPYPSQRGLPLMKRIGAMFTDGRTWGTLLYMLLLLPLGLFYFTVTLTLLAVSLGFAAAPVLKLVSDLFRWQTGTCIGAPEWICAGIEWLNSWAGSFVLCLLGIVMLFATLHLVRGLGRLQGLIAKQLLVRAN